MSPKILFVSHGLNDTGWGQVSQNILDAMRQKFDVVSRTIEFQKSHDIDWHQELLRKPVEGITHVIQYVLPHFLRSFPNAVNIGMTEIENVNLQYSPWIEHYHKVDKLLVSNTEASEELQRHLNCDVVVLPHPLNEEIYKRDFESIELPSTDGNYKFYTIADNIPRKYLIGLLKAFYLEFDPSEPVSLIIKTNENISDMCNHIKERLDLYPKQEHYQQEVIINGHLTNSQIYGLHQLCNCYCTASVGESWGQPFYDSQGFGNVAVFPDNGGLFDLATHISNEKKNVGLVETTPTVGLGGGIFRHDQNARTSCFIPRVKDIGERMRAAYRGELEPMDVSHLYYEQFNSYLSNILESN